MNSNITSLEKKLGEFYNDDNVQVLFIIGSSKSGKTTITESFLNANKIDHLKPEINETKQQFEESINNFVHVNSDIFYNMFVPDYAASRKCTMKCQTYPFYRRH